MANKNVSDDFISMPIWDNMTFEDPEDLSYPISDFSQTNIRVSSRSTTLTDSPHQTDFYARSNSSSDKARSPQDVTYGYQLPSPQEDDILLDPIAIDKERRREQNRVAQRAFRERKESKLKQLERKIADLKADQRQLEKKYHSLRTAHLRLQSGLKILLDASGTFDEVDAEIYGADSHTEFGSDHR